MNIVKIETKHFAHSHKFSSSYSQPIRTNEVVNFPRKIVLLQQNKYVRLFGRGE